MFFWGYVNVFERSLAAGTMDSDVLISIIQSWDVFRAWVLAKDEILIYTVGNSTCGWEYFEVWFASSYGGIRV